jgi:general stress protein 26
VLSVVRHCGRENYFIIETHSAPLISRHCELLTPVLYRSICTPHTVISREMKTPSTRAPDSVKKLGELIHDIKFAMLTTAHADGTLHSRPMTTQQVEFDGNLWFFSGLNSEKIQELEAHPEVNVSYSAPDDQRYVSVSGRAEVSRDRGKMEELWNPMFKAWFPKGLDDPDICLLHVNVTHAEYWDSPSSKMVQLAGFIKAVVTGKRLENAGEHEELHIHSAKADLKDPAA